MFRDILRHKVQFFAITVTVLIGVSFYSTLIIAMNNLVNSYNYVYEQLHYADFTVLLNPTPQKVVRELKEVENVENVEGRITLNIGIYINGTRQIAGLATGINSTHQPTVNNVKIESGRYFRPDELNACLLEHHFAAAYGYKEGENVTLIIHGVKVNFTVVGVVASPEHLIIMSGTWEYSSGHTYGVVFLPLEGLQKILDMVSMINEIVATVKDASEINATIAHFKEILSPYGVIKVIRKSE